MLRVDDLALETLGAGEIGRVALVVAVITARAEKEAAGQLEPLAGIRALYLHRPARLRA